MRAPLFFRAVRSRRPARLRLMRRGERVLHPAPRGERPAADAAAWEGVLADVARDPDKAVFVKALRATPVLRIDREGLVLDVRAGSEMARFLGSVTTLGYPVSEYSGRYAGFTPELTLSAAMARHFRVRCGGELGPPVDFARPCFPRSARLHEGGTR